MRLLRPLLLIAVALCGGCYTVTPGTAIVRVRVCGDGSDPYDVYTAGRLWNGPCTDDFTIPLQEQRVAWEASSGEDIRFSGVDGQAVSVDVGLAYQIESDEQRIIHLIKTYGTALDVVIDGKVRDVTRDSLNDCAATMEVGPAEAGRKGLTVQDIYGAEKTPLFECAEVAVRDEFAADGLRINRLTLNSDIRLPERIKVAMEEAQKATQEADRIKRELEGTRATEEKKIIVAEADAKERMLRAQAAADAQVIAAKAEAEANDLLTRSLTPGVLEFRRLEIEAARVAKWSGAVPSTVLSDGGAAVYHVNDD